MSDPNFNPGADPTDYPNSTKASAQWFVDRKNSALLAKVKADYDSYVANVKAGHSYTRMQIPNKWEIYLDPDAGWSYRETSTPICEPLPDFKLSGPLIPADPSELKPGFIDIGPADLSSDPEEPVFFTVGKLDTWPAGTKTPPLVIAPFTTPHRFRKFGWAGFGFKYERID